MVKIKYVMKSAHSFFSLRTFLFLGPLFFFPQFSHAIILTLTQTPGGPGKTYTLSWTAATKSTDTSNITYYVFSEFGRDAVDHPDLDEPMLTPTTHSNFIVSKLNETSYIFDSNVGSRGFVVISEDSFDSRNEISNEVHHNFIHMSQANDGVVLGITDDDGTMRGIGQKWRFSWYMDDNAYITMRIFPPGTTFNYDANGFATGTVGGVPPVKTIIDTGMVPRPGETGGGSVKASDNDDFWDCRSSTGVVVPNGIYYVYLQARLDPGQWGYSEGALRSGITLTIPVNILRIMELNATGITLNNPTSVISYTINGDAVVRVLIAQPGTGFTIDSHGDVQPTDRTTGAIDTSLIVSTFSFYRKAGSNSESWDGVSSTGTVMPSGIYGLGISAQDGYGNKAVDASGNNFPVFTTINLERTLGSNTGTQGPTDTTAPTLDSISPASNPPVLGAVSTITVVLADEPGGSQLNIGNCNIQVTDPNGNTLNPTVTNNGVNTLTAVFTPSLTANGTYRVTVTARDNANNSQMFNEQFTISIGLSQGEFEAGYILYPNPAKNTPVTIRYDLAVASKVDIEIFNVMGERVKEFKRDDAAAIAIKQPWDLRNESGEKVGSGVYIVKIKASGGGATVKTTKKLVVIQ